MTPEQKATLHRILIDAKLDIKHGRLYDHDGDECAGICQYVRCHKEGGYDLGKLIYLNMYKKSSFYKRKDFVAKPFDFSHPDRLALLDWLINETKP